MGAFLTYSRAGVYIVRTLLNANAHYGADSEWSRSQGILSLKVCFYNTQINIDWQMNNTTFKICSLLVFHMRVNI